MTEDVGSTILIELVLIFKFLLDIVKDKVEMDCEIRCNDVCTFYVGLDLFKKTTKSNHICCKVCSSFEASFFVESFSKQKCYFKSKLEMKSSDLQDSGSLNHI